VVFAHHTESLERLPPPAGESRNGSLSYDGTEIAFRLARPDHRDILGIVRRDGTGLREYPEIEYPGDVCWSYDGSKLATVAGNPYRLLILDLAARTTQDVGKGFVLSQCWSADGKQIVYENREADTDSIRVYDIEHKQSRELTKGKDATWSPNGAWIAFRDRDTYYAIRPSGLDRRRLFRKKGIEYAALWSPDSRIVAYVAPAPWWAIIHDPVNELSRIYIRRLQDGSQDWVEETGSADSGLVTLQWINPQH
jgi:Tol biopolymer transport system component